MNDEIAQSDTTNQPASTQLSTEQSLAIINNVTHIATVDQEVIQNFLRQSGANRRLLAQQFKLLLLLSQFLLAKGSDGLRPCYPDVFCPTFSSMNYILYVTNCFEDLRYGNWGPCKCADNGQSIFENVTPKLLANTCGPLSFNNTLCFNDIYEHTVGEFHHILFQRSSLIANSSYNMFEECVVQLINDEHENQQFPWAILGYVALGIAGTCALGAGLYYGRKHLMKWCGEIQAKYQTDRRLQELSQQTADENTPLYNL